ncbi:MAG: hypothetical protein ACPGJS_22290, partial [Flammeovirgaceae bacterium]
MGKYLRTLAGDLLNLEVNTIIKENTSSAKMPNSRRVALLRIADQYRSYMIEQGLCQKAPGRSYQPEKEDHTRYFRWRFGGEYSFIEIASHAKSARKDVQRMINRAKTKEQERKLEKVHHMLDRIVGKASNIIGLFKMRRKEFEEEIANDQELFAEKPDLSAIESDYQPFESQTDSVGWNNDVSIQDINKVEDIDLTPEHITMIRKVWEIGMEQVLLQTTVQIDGDITSVISREFLNMPDRTKDMVMKVHEDSISSSTRIWKMLFETIGKLAG